MAEAVFSLFITMIVLLMLQNLLKSLQTANKSSHHADEVAYSYVQLNRFLHQSEYQRIYVDPDLSNENKVIICKVKRQGGRNVIDRYAIEQYEDMIRARGWASGHMPLLLHVKKSRFTAKNGQFKIWLQEEDKRVSELVFKVDPKPKR
ncbi:MULTISPECIES: ComGF family competence protein [Lactobacillus]|uniref:ComGF family competence protein n=1 Tax=Lactobacillus TaxID=1578 RepID=UPI0013747D3B|nr:MULTISPECIES: ComGF family competence protein [Lactobacillus]